MFKLAAKLAWTHLRALRHGQTDPHDRRCPAYARSGGPCRCAGVGRMCTCLWAKLPPTRVPVMTYRSPRCPVHRTRPAHTRDPEQ
jgi:hypothetical protein